jgi:DNA/RNA-binding protein KIN17
VPAQLVYNEYIANKTHIHMNGARGAALWRASGSLTLCVCCAATKWSSLTEFIKDMALRGVVTIEDTPKGWFMVYKPKDAEETLRTAMNAKRERNGEIAEERAEREMEAQLAKIARLEAKAAHKLAHLDTLTHGTDQPDEKARKRAVIEAALARARAKAQR